MLEAENEIITILFSITERSNKRKSTVTFALTPRRSLS